jgi:SAM-dependent methyltransferase
MGLDFSHASVDSLGLDGQRCNEHAESGGPDLTRALKHTGIPEGSRIIDIGSGKGAATITMARLPFWEVAGVEISAPLVDAAMRNTAKLGLKVNYWIADATTFTDLDRFTHVYLFHSFPDSIAQVVMDNLMCSLLRAPRRLTLILKYPHCPDHWVPKRLRKLDELRYSGSHPFYIYSS